jgi:2,4-dienoyl-CoA reductase-like NADH-dependent reductase (Old Yellow Enzyme family)
MGDDNPEVTFGHVAEELGKRSIAFIMSRERRGADSLGPMIRERFGGTYVLNEDFDLSAVEAALATGDADAVGFGRLFIANPALPERLAHERPLNEPESETYYTAGEKEYIDYPKWT